MAKNNNTSVIQICPKCKNTKLRFRREETGVVKTRNGSVHKQRTVAICQTCGYTWDVAGVNPKRKVPFGVKIAIIAGALLIIGFIASIIGSLSYQKHLKERIPGYEVTQDNEYLVTNPSVEYVQDCLEKTSYVQSIASITKGVDNNTNLKFVYSPKAIVYFTCNMVESKEILEGDRLVDEGVKAGGSIEIYDTVERAKRQNEKLGKITSFTGNESHVQIGTLVIRLSDKMSFEEQDELEDVICNLLLAE